MGVNVSLAPSVNYPSVMNPAGVQTVVGVNIPCPPPCQLPVNNAALEGVQMGRV